MFRNKPNSLDQFFLPKQKKEPTTTSSVDDRQEKSPQEIKQIYIPLAEKQRPKNLEDIIGQEDILAIGTPFNTMIKNDKIQSTILYGPPGCGKTTIAGIIKNNSKSTFISMSAATSKKEDFKKVINDAKHRKRMGINTILFLDEIHSLNRLQQDTFLPAIESGTIILIGATTENPSFELNNALMSRCQLVTLKKLTDEDVVKIMRKAIDEEYCNSKIDIDNEGLHFIAAISDGDARSALNTLEKVFVHFNLMSEKVLKNEINEKGGIDIEVRELEEKVKKGEIKVLRINGKIVSIIDNKNEKQKTEEIEKGVIDKTDSVITISDDISDVVIVQPEPKEITQTEGDVFNENIDSHIKEITKPNEKLKIKKVEKKYILTYKLIENYLQRNIYQPKNQGEDHFKVLTAFQKSITHSDEEATIYWLQRLIEMGENPKYIVRRMIKISSEDIGLADVEALNIAVKTFQIVSSLGYPEADTALYECALYLARAPKSCAVFETMKYTEEIIKQTGSLPVPLHIRNAPTSLMEKMGYSVGYKYPPNYNEVLDQTYLPEKLINTKLVFYDRFVKPINKDDIIMKAEENDLSSGQVQRSYQFRNFDVDYCKDKKEITQIVNN
ncbi:AAA family ATPase, putative [Entamoeba histolytica HM-1:IMSS-B]|uniref:AAA family ATPase putative n=4 Tax=Entamoeba histolytica TaxID=5759 RepID=A0A175JEI8_ENTHI|nr:replication factor C small subunit, putative [Entamoeba histolytica KU27]EMH74071.1 AAA family ATPase, putative [Entamoeba histolytica HM-1:IMSS-B]EMS13635.1 replication factor C small subunit [Entamoeba histolytica HM-3:IMSS]GAT91802.1 AAA family ATPase putative [Entamoeba histolytica]